MAPSILVAYATKYGSTAEVAEAVGRRLRERGLDADVKRVRDVPSLDAYDAVVFSAPLYIGSMLKDGVAFLERHKASLEDKPVAVFALGPMKREELEQDPGQLDTALEKVAWLKPVATQLFVGKYDPAKLRLADKLLAVLPASPLYHAPARDERDWPAIEAWADGLPAALGVGTPVS